MLGAHADADEPRGDAAKDGEAGEEPQREGQPRGSRAAKDGRDDPPLGLHLEPLREARRLLAPSLDLRQLIYREPSLRQRSGQQVGRGDRVL